MAIERTFAMISVTTVTSLQSRMARLEELGHRVKLVMDDSSFRNGLVIVDGLKHRFCSHIESLEIIERIIDEHGRLDETIHCSPG